MSEPQHDPSFWHAERAYLQGFTPLRAYLRGPIAAAASSDVSVTCEDLPLLDRVRLDGFRVALAMGPAVDPRLLQPDAAGNKTAVFPPLGLMNLAGFLRGHGASVSIHDAFVDGTFGDAEKLALSEPGRVQQALGGSSDPGLDALLDRWIAQLAPDQADVIALSAANAADGPSFVLLKRRMLATGRRVPLVAGGHWLEPELAPFANELDALILEEGEAPLLLACRAIARGSSTRWIPGVCFSRPDGGWHLHKATHSMDVRAAPDLDGFALERYTYRTYTGWKGPVIPYQFMVGCPYNCAYCNATHKRRVKRRALGLVLSDLARLRERHGIRQFFFLSEAFNGDRRYAEALLAGMLAAGAEQRWCDCARPTGIDAALLQRTRAAGCEWLNWGLDTPSDRLSHLYGRHVDNETFAAVLRASTDAGIRNSVNVILGLPHEADADVEEFLRFVDTHHRLIHHLFFFTYDYIPHSDIGRFPERYGLRPAPDHHGVDEIGGLEWSARREQGAESLRRVKSLLARRYGYT